MLGSARTAQSTTVAHAQRVPPRVPHLSSRVQVEPQPSQVVRAAAAAVAALEEACAQLARDLQNSTGHETDSGRRVASLSERLAHTRATAKVWRR